MLWRLYLQAARHREYSDEGRRPLPIPYCVGNGTTADRVTPQRIVVQNGAVHWQHSTVQTAVYFVHISTVPVLYGTEINGQLARLNLQSLPPATACR